MFLITMTLGGQNVKFAWLRYISITECEDLLL